MLNKWILIVNYFLFSSMGFAGELPCQGNPGKSHSHGGGFVEQTARAAPTAYIGKEASVCGGAKVYGKAQVLDQAIVTDNAEVFGQAVVKGQGMIMGAARVFGEAVVQDEVVIRGKAIIKDKAIVSGQGRIEGLAIVKKSKNLANGEVVYSDD